MDIFDSHFYSRQFSVYEFLPFAWSFGIKILSHIFQYSHVLSVARSLDLILAGENKNHPLLKKQAEVGSEANTRFTLFITLLTSGLGAIIITSKNDQLSVGIFVAFFIFLGVAGYYFLESKHMHERYFTHPDRALKILIVFLFLDFVLFAVSFLTAPLTAP